MIALTRVAFVVFMFLFLPLGYAADIPLVKVPTVAVAAFYIDNQNQILAAEYLVGVTGRRIRAYIPAINPPATWANPPLQANDEPAIAIPDEAVFAIYLNIESKICAIEMLNGVKGRVGMDLGVPLEGPPACATRCILAGPNGSYCMPGCH